MSGTETVLIIGAGGREHALAWRVLQSNHVGKVLVAPGNGGTANEADMENIPIPVDDFAALTELAQKRKVALAIVGPEMPLAGGIVDYFEKRGLPCFGPHQKSAMLESSKTFAKHFLRRHDIATAAFASFTNLKDATDYIKKQQAPVVIKADGLAAGKGVVIADTIDLALTAAQQMLQPARSDGQPPTIVVEQFLQGEEASFIVIADGCNCAVFATSQDHKRVFDQDLGPNTGGMGAYSPAPVITDRIHAKIMAKIIAPTLAGMAQEGAAYKGFLYVGLMITDAGEAMVLEFNCRFGDPEAQPVLLRLQDDLYELCQQAVGGNLRQQALVFDQRPALGVVMTAEGYPGRYEQGHSIHGLVAAAVDPLCKVFHAGTRQQQDALLTAGGRVLCVTALGDDIGGARDNAYRACDKISYSGAFYRRDIGVRALSAASTKR